MKYALMSLALLLAGTGFNAAHASELIQNGEHPVGDNQNVSLRADVADIEITATDGHTIEWRLEVSSDERSFLFWESDALPIEALQRIKVSVEEQGDTLVLKAEIPEEFEDENISLDWFIRIPQHLQLDLETDVGDIDINSMTGGSEVVTDVGDVELRNTSGRVDIRTDVGDVNLHSHAGNVEVESDVGDVTIDITSGDVAVESDVGDVEITLPVAQLKALDLTADIGDIEVKIAGREIPASYPEHGPGAELHKTFNEQGSRINVRTDVGDIEIEGK